MMPHVHHLGKILDKLLKVKNLIKDTLTKPDVTFSTPTINSNNGKAALTVRYLWDHLVYLNTDILYTKNITGKQTGRKGLHLNKVGSTRLFKTYGNFVFFKTLK